MRLLEPEMLLEKQKNEMKRNEAWRVYGALLVRFSSYPILVKFYIDGSFKLDLHGCNKTLLLPACSRSMYI